MAIKPGSVASRVTDNMAEEMNFLRHSCPDSAEFLGKKFILPKPKRSDASKARKLDIAKLRMDVNNLIVNGKISQSRKDLEASLSKFPFVGELHALAAIQKYYDVVNGGVKGEKVKMLKSCLIGIAKGLANGGDSIYNTNWFITIYRSFLETYNDRCSRMIAASADMPSNRIAEARREIQAKQRRIRFLLGIGDKTAGLERLNTVLNGTTYLTEHLDVDELKDACKALLKNDPKATVGPKKKKMSHIISIYHTLTLLYSSIPILAPLTELKLSKMPEMHRDLVLRKQMILTNQLITQYHLDYAMGAKASCRAKSQAIFEACQKTIREHLRAAILTRQFEVDPYLKMATITRESQDINASDINKGRAKIAAEQLEVVIGKRGQVKGTLPAAQDLKRSMLNILDIDV